MPAKLFTMFRHIAILFILSLCFALPARAQNPYKKLTYTIDTVTYSGNRLIRQRAARADLDKLYKKDAAAARPLIALQDALDNKDVSAAYLAISSLKSVAPGFDRSLYEQEAAVYMKLRDEPKYKVNEDSLRFANTIAQKRLERQQNEQAGKWQKDSMDIVETYGSMNEFMYQNEMREKSNNQKRILYIGYSTNWYSFMPGYMEKFMACTPQNDANGDLDAVAEGKDIVKFIVTCSGKKVFIRMSPVMSAGNKPIVAKMSISGDPASLISLFLGFWEINDIDKSKLKKGSVVTHNYLSDRITFNWKGAAPVINIDRNPDYHADR